VNHARQIGKTPHARVVSFAFALLLSFCTAAVAQPSAEISGPYRGNPAETGVAVAAAHDQVLANPKAVAGQPLIVTVRPSPEWSDAQIAWIVIRDGVASRLKESDFDYVGPAASNTIYCANVRSGRYTFTAIAVMGEKQNVLKPATVEVAEPSSSRVVRGPTRDGRLAATLETDRRPAESETATAPANVARFKEQLLDTIDRVGLWKNDIKFAERRTQVVAALRAIAADSTLSEVEDVRAAPMSGPLLPCIWRPATCLRK